MNNNDLKMVNTPSFRKDPKEMSVEELDSYLAVKTKNFQNIINTSNSNINRNSPLTSNGFQAQNNKIQNPFLQSLSASPLRNSPAQSSYFQYTTSTSNQTNSKAGNDYIKSLQDKISKLQKENNELKSNFIKVSEMLSDERNNRNTYSGGKEKIDMLIKENKQLYEANEGLKKENQCYQEQVKMIEQEKQRHIEQGIQEKEFLTNTINDLKSQLETMNGKYLILNNQFELVNQKYNELLSPQNEHIKKVKKAIKKTKIKEKPKTPSQTPNLFIKRQTPSQPKYKKITVKSTNENNPVKKKVIKKRNSSNCSKQTSNRQMINKSYNMLPKSHRSTNISHTKDLSCISNRKLKYEDTEEKENTDSSIPNNKEVIAGRGGLERLVNESTNNYIQSQNTELDSINSQILVLESNIEQLKINYQNLLPKLNSLSGQEEQMQIRNNLNMITGNLEEKTYQLLTLRKKQQIILQNTLNEKVN